MLLTMCHARALVPVTLASFACCVPAAVAHNRPQLTFQKTFPVAYRLCQRAEQGKLPKRLEASVAQVMTDCQTLESSYTAAQSTFTSTIPPLKAQVQAAREQARSTCKTSGRRSDACQQAIATFKQTFATIKTQVKAAVQAYVQSVRSARRTFWTAVKALRGAQNLPTDSGGTPSPPPVDLGSGTAG